MLALIIFVLFILGIEFYSFFGLKASILNNFKLLSLIYIVTFVFTLIGFFLLVKTARSEYSSISLNVNILFGLAFALVLAKLFMSTIFLVEDIFRGFIWLFQSVFKFRMAEMISRSFILGVMALIFGGTLALLINYGVLFGRYQFKTHHQILEYENLPDEFIGFKIAHISDLHLGTFDQIKRVQRGLNQLQKENPDVILFTGDMVNNRAEEVLPFIDMFSKLYAPYGKYSVLGNHDYGEYVRWKSEADKQANIEKLKGFEKQMGFKMLLNQNITISKNEQSIYIAGVENWGTPPFPQYGNLEEAIKGKTSDDFIVLMSHDPTHWREKVISSPTKVELTLSGHTHGMQFGIEIGKFKWSPVKYRYPDWAGLYSFNELKLYVNRGFGSIGFPGRVGIWPEITIIELHKK